MAKFPFYMLSLVLFAGIGEGHDVCKVSRCEEGPAIRFPFWLKNENRTVSVPGHGVTPEFELTCNERNQTVLQLPYSVNLLVKRIDYESQWIEVYDGEGCLPKQFINLNLSASPFQIYRYTNLDEYGFINSDPYGFINPDSYGFINSDPYALYNCSAPHIKFTVIPCLSTVSGYQIYGVSSNDYDSLTSCTRIGSYTASRYDFLFKRHNLLLHWLEPNSPICQSESKTCSGQCFDYMPLPETPKGSSIKQIVTATVISVFLVLALLVVVVVVLHRVSSSNKALKEDQAKIEIFLEDYRALKPSRYSYDDIKKITNQFKEKLGQGGYGTVFKGKLSNDIFVAVKVLNNSKEKGDEFINEVGTIGRIHHVNVVRLVGFCADGSSRALVYEFCQNDSLEKFIFSEDQNNHFLGWEKLQEIAVGIAKGIEYLHQGCDQRILHFDIKPHNILLDHNFNPKVCDFGLAKLCSKELSAVSMTAARGTMGYIAPEVFSRNFGNVSYKSDVYSFGMLLLEMVGGRKNIDVKVENTSQTYFPEWIYNRLYQGEELGMISIEKEEHAKIAEKLAIVGLWCIQWYPVDRPSMKIVVQMLEKEGNKLTIPPNPFAAATETNTSSIKTARAFNRELTVILE